MQINYSLSEDIYILEVAGSLTGYESTIFEQAVSEILQISSKHFRQVSKPDDQNFSKGIVLDCSQLEIIDSMGLGSLVRCLKKSEIQNSYFYLAGLQHEPLLMFEISQMDRLFKTFQNVEAAIASLHKNLESQIMSS